MTELEMQTSIVAEINLRANQDPRWGYIFHVPNGGDRNVIVAAKLKAAGVRAGVPDFLWLLPACGYYGMAMELKMGRSKPTTEQAAWLQWLSDRNFFVCVVRNDPSEAIGIFERYLGGVR